MAEKNTKRIEFFLRMLYALAALLALLGVLIQVGLIDGGTTYAVALLAVAIWFLCIAGNRSVPFLIQSAQ
jgi:hypothetical protein